MMYRVTCFLCERGVVDDSGGASCVVAFERSMESRTALSGNDTCPWSLCVGCFTRCVVLVSV